MPLNNQGEPNALNPDLVAYIERILGYSLNPVVQRVDKESERVNSIMVRREGGADAKQVCGGLL